MVITEHGERDQIAVLEEDVLVQHYVTRAGATSMVGNVYLGRVQNVLPGMEAAFVDIGRGRNGVLYAGEVNYSPEDLEGPAPRIEQLLKPGQAVMVQVTKDPMGGKGARLTARSDAAGRYLVLAPNQNLSGHQPPAARRRAQAAEVDPEEASGPTEHGVIVRTAAEGATEEELDDRPASARSTSGTRSSQGEEGQGAGRPLRGAGAHRSRGARPVHRRGVPRRSSPTSQRVYDKVMAYLHEVAPDLAPKVHAAHGPAAGVRGAPHRRADPQGARQEGVAARRAATCSSSAPRR